VRFSVHLDEDASFAVADRHCDRQFLQQERSPLHACRRSPSPAESSRGRSLSVPEVEPASRPEQSPVPRFHGGRIEGFQENGCLAPIKKTRCSDRQRKPLLVVTE
jgi:hypothetical protein